MFVSGKKGKKRGRGAKKKRASARRETPAGNKKRLVQDEHHR